MTSPHSESQPELLNDTPVLEVEVGRLADIFDEQGLEYRIEEHNHPENPENPAEAAGTFKVLRTGFSNTVIAMQVRGETLIVDSVWRGQVPTSEGSTLLSLINQWNGEHFAPTLRFFESNENSLAVSAVREMHIGAGASRNQLGAFVMSTLNSILESFAWIESHYPQLVTWEVRNHEH